MKVLPKISTCITGIFVEISGFLPRGGSLKGNYNNFRNHTLLVTCPRRLWTSSKRYYYPNKSRVWGGSEFYAMLYMSKALNFNFKLKKSVDGKYGRMVDKETKAFNGMVGMVQRLVSTYQAEYIS